MYEELIDRDPTLATEERNDMNLVYRAALWAKGFYQQSFISSYLDLITQHGADMLAVDGIGYTPLHLAALRGSPYVADYLCRKLPAEHIDRWNDSPHRLESSTSIEIAAEKLDDNTRRLQLPDTRGHQGTESRRE